MKYINFQIFFQACAESLRQLKSMFWYDEETSEDDELIEITDECDSEEDTSEFVNDSLENINNDSTSVEFPELNNEKVCFMFEIEISQDIKESKII